MNEPLRSQYGPGQFKAFRHNLPEPIQHVYANNEIKIEPYDIPQQLQHQSRYMYSTNPNSYSEQELAESLGWVDYPHSAQPDLSSNTAQVSHDMAMRHGMDCREPAIDQSGSFASNTTFDSIAPNSRSPAGWHSSMESPNFLTDTTHGGMGSVDGSTAQRNGKTVADKKALRRYSHNAVERRRRDTINEQIQELAALVLDYGSPRSPAAELASQRSNRLLKPNKGVVLRKSVEYIHQLRTLLEDKNERELQMENEIRRLGGNVPSHPQRDQNLSMWLDESAIAEDD